MPESTQHARLLIVEDDDELAELLSAYLMRHGFELERVARGDVGVERIVASQPDLVILDLMLPGMSGLEVCRAVRAHYGGAILMLTASQSEADHVAGLELGAEDFVIKPIEPRVLLARIRTQLRRIGGVAVEDTQSVELGSLRIDTRGRRTHVGETEVALTSMEFDILWMLARHAGSVVERERLYTDILKTDYDGIDRGMDVHVSRIRKKLSQAGLTSKQLKSIRGAGYLLAVS